MKFVILSLILLVIMNKIIALPSPSHERQKRDDYDNIDVDSIIQSLSTYPLEDNVREALFDAASLPRDDVHGFSSYSAPIVQEEPESHYVSVAEPVHAVGVESGLGLTVNKNVVLAPQVEIFRFVEAFVLFKKELLARFQHIINENWELIRGVINMILGKLQKLQGATLVFISILRQILEFAVNIFSSFRINLPSISLGVSGHADSVHPSETYGVPSIFSLGSELFG
ncbi:hypothetical protein FQA39_LY09341 [Lamprigera yunnana]|nr:hypothetical protein FQA39_LY09341 [Lamprigera yunnana]